MARISVVRSIAKFFAPDPREKPGRFPGEWVPEGMFLALAVRGNRVRRVSLDRDAILPDGLFDGAFAPIPTVRCGSGQGVSSTQLRHWPREFGASAT
jgi:hypothetical protein